MIFGIGCDIVEIERISAMDKRFLEKHFTQAERDLFMRKNNAPQTVAANFSAKEAFSKALGTGVRGFSLEDVEVLRDELGKPYINVYDGAKKLCEESGIKNIFVSLSHSKENAVAYVVLEKE